MGEAKALSEIYAKIENKDITDLKNFCDKVESFDVINDDHNDTKLYPLHFAVVNDFIEAVELFIEKGADINFNYKETALFAAVKNQNKKMVDLLLEKGADLNALNYRVLFFVFMKKILFSFH
ncbi:hypothetical protein TRFO_36546 [Tritrichomonas foetus]|uniref:Uncharacterized protein n=1 Tax=Tritrichomonas foetus TaxID=1144522 RepID=A0A1J4JDS5_9EUKA|nr:hypothetical protein TRFO_36546 [Tritrichomonas foetus]|eukprot:OHS97306.1 hypothetical protein TRFO_36546 [Tritrichomonas foetus]